VANRDMRKQTVQNWLTKKRLLKRRVTRVEKDERRILHGKIMLPHLAALHKKRLKLNRA